MRSFVLKYIVLKYIRSHGNVHIGDIFMETKKIDLYEYFKIRKPEGARGVLTTYIRDLSPEINPDRKAPAMLVIPGGGYYMVSDREGEPVAMRYLALGFNSFVLNYSVAEDSPLKYPYQIAEAAMAMAYIRLNAESLNIDPEKVAAVGFSAGGHLCAMLGSFHNCPDVDKIFKPNVCVKPNAIVLGYPVISSDITFAHIGSFINLCGEENKELMKKVDVLNLIDENSAPAFIWSTFNDNCVPCQNAIEAALQYKKVGVPVSVHVFGKGEHGLSVADMTVYKTDEAIKEMSVSVPEWIRLSVEWLEEQGVCVTI